MEFTTADICVFVLTILITFSIGVLFAIREMMRKRNTPEHYFLAGRKSKMLPVTLSFVVTFQSSILMLGFPAEVYAYGAMVAYNVVAISLAFVFTAFFIIPVFYPLKLISIYQYFNLRYGDNYLRYLTMGMGTFYSIFYMGTVTYGTCIALEVVLEIPAWATIVFYTTITAIYTSIGGIKAVLWTDVFQFIIMVTGILAVIVKGLMETGGVERVIHLAETRTHLLEISLDPRTRYTVWSLCIGCFTYWLFMSYMQPAMQRVYTTSSMTAARNLYLTAAPIFSFVMLLTCIEGLVTFAYYVSKRCDILEAGVVHNINSIIPFTVLELFRNQPGLPGLFIAALSSAALSTLSSCLSSLSAVTYIDIIQVRYPDISATTATKMSKIVVLAYGLVAMGMAFLISVLPGTVMALFQTFVASLDGPTCAVFLLSAMYRRATTKGVFTGAVVGMLFPLWINLGRLFSDIPADPYLPSGPTDGCSVFTSANTSYEITSIIGNLSTACHTNLTMNGGNGGIAYTIHGIEHLYTISYLWLSLTGFVISVMVGVAVSLFTEAPKEFDERCIFSFRQQENTEPERKEAEQPCLMVSVNSSTCI